MCKAGVCESGGYLRLTSPTGYLASSAASLTGCGSTTCPWVLTPPRGQRFNLTFYNFVQLDPVQQIESKYCQRLATIADKMTRVSNDVTVCTGQQQQQPHHQFRTVHHVTAESTTVEIRLYRGSASLIPAQSGSGPGGAVVAAAAAAGDSAPAVFYSLVKYEAIGCADLKAPSGAWTKRDGDSLSIGCEGVQRSWHLTCNGTTWVGKIGSCDDASTGTAAAAAASGQAGNWNVGLALQHASSTTHGLLLVVAIGVVLGIVLGFSMLAVAVMVIKRRRSNQHTKLDLNEEQMMIAAGHHAKIGDVTNPNNLYNGIDRRQQFDMTSSEAVYYRTYQSARDGLPGVVGGAPMPGHAYCTTMRADVSLCTSSAKGLAPPPPPPPPCDVILTS
jgi:hypothetical protein